ncbi:60S ribosomal protein L7a, putative [Eimeria tenella]|uniref:60S ribosomal protein L7a n=1 Tax=Eimeria tenella TaxID=5802 RepID=U6KYN6_EIMTE|nr:60S ribosomal protein L7a, putative [Eimeria tenella]CDJ43292.1 60S ribosomal protein L7a, putative [Eimeria tenella]|eukprot:XP_013234042.1 60S ribosomal protein L7a, putative [Eimeria tenella]
MAPAAKKGASGSSKKKLPSDPTSAKNAKKTTKSLIFQKTPRNFRIGCSIQPRRELTRFVKWPKYVLLQRQRRVLMQRLKVPPAINQFTHTLDKNQTGQLLRLLAKYKPETRGEKKARLIAEGEKQSSGAQATSKKPVMLKFGLNHVTDLIEIKKAKLVVIAHDVVPIDLVCWLPALCRKKDVPYCIVKGKARLGQLVHKKTCAVIAVDAVRKEDQAELEAQCKNYRAMFNDNSDLRRRWGGGHLGIKSQHAQEKKQKLIDAEMRKKAGLQIA